MSKIIVSDNYCKIEEELDISFLWALDKELSYQIMGYKHMPSFRGYYNKSGQFIKWDGRQKLLTDRLCFPTGLLQRVKDFCDKNNKSYHIEDVRPPKSSGRSIDIINKLSAIGKTPYYYQLDAMKAAEQNDRGIIRLATGGGKTVVMALITASLGKTTIIYVIGKDLLYQIHKLFQSLFDQKIGIIGDGLCEIHDINIASIWTVGQAVGLKKSKIVIDDDDIDEKNVAPEKYQDIKDMLHRTKVHLFDECQICSTNTITEISKNIVAEHIIGLSASPWRDDGADLMLEALLGKKIIDISASILIREGYLVRPIIKFLKVPPMPKSKEHFQTIYKKYVVENEVRNSFVIKGAEKLVEQGYQTLVLYNSIAHGEALYEQIHKKVPCALLSGADNSDVRAAVKDKLESEKIKCIVASKIYDIGVDLPSLSGLVLAGAGKSSVRSLQRCGRVLRKYPGKKQSAVIDFYDQAPYLKDHSKARKKIYESEEEFKIIWPGK